MTCVNDHDIPVAEEVQNERSSRSVSPVKPAFSEYEAQRAKNIAENKALFHKMFGDNMWGDLPLPKGKGKQKGNILTRCVFLILVSTFKLNMLL